MTKQFKGEVRLDVRDSTEDWSAFRETTAPAGAPNVLVVLYDDTGLAGLCVGRDSGDAVSEEYQSPFAFTGGRIGKVEVSVGDDAYVALEQQFAAAMARD